jgi:hypothetical protein
MIRLVGVHADVPKTEREEEENYSEGTALVNGCLESDVLPT